MNPETAKPGDLFECLRKMGIYTTLFVRDDSTLVTESNISDIVHLARNGRYTSKFKVRNLKSFDGNVLMWTGETKGRYGKFLLGEEVGWVNCESVDEVWRG